MRTLIAIALLGACGSTSRSTIVTEKSCTSADAPTLVDAVTRCGTIYSEDDGGCRAVRVEGTTRGFQFWSGPESGVFFRQSFRIRSGTEIEGGHFERVDAKGNLVPDGGIADAACGAPTYSVAALESGVFEIRIIDGLPGQPTVSIWHVDKARCEISRLARTAPVGRVAVLVGCS